MFSYDAVYRAVALSNLSNATSMLVMDALFGISRDANEQVSAADIETVFARLGICQRAFVKFMHDLEE